jgi:transmembrane protein EpsG
MFKTYGKEVGYVLLNRLIGIFTDKAIVLILITSFIVVFLYFREIKKDSANVWLSVLLFVTIGQYYISFNLIRQIISAGIIFSGSKYLYERNFKRYLLVILIASLFHKTAAIMLIFYFVLNFKFNFKQLIMVLIGAIGFFLFTDSVLTFIQKYFYAHYTQSGYGMVGFNYKNIVLPVSVFIFMLFHKNYLDTKVAKINIWVNAVTFYAFFNILGIKIQMIERLANFFAPYVILLIPYIIMKIGDKHLRILYLFIFVFLSIAYNYIGFKGTGYDPFYFIWN